MTYFDKNQSKKTNISLMMKGKCVLLYLIWYTSTAYEKNVHLVNYNWHNYMPYSLWGKAVYALSTR